MGRDVTVADQRTDDDQSEQRPALPAFPAHRNHAYNEIQGRGGVNVWAVVSLVFGLCGVVVGGFAAGILALYQVRDRPQKGRGLAVAGVSLSAVWTLLLGIGFATGTIGLP
ncbi:DUF4190 domain-containing protein [Actinomadura scrupuli]|uniref:DUF4190 domain-containing protein n=1 Tax=Actinomadura scrupuli TaxID=559629 RepID=UPI003D97FB0F